MQPADSAWLEDALGRLAEEASLPVTPDLASRVLASVKDNRPARPASRLIVKLAAVAAIALVAIAIGISASREAREAVADFLGLGVEGERIEVLSPTVGPRPSTPTATITPDFEGFAEPVSLAEAQERMTFAIVVPEGVEVEQVYVLDFLGLEGVVLRTSEYDLWQFRNDRGQFLGKGIYGSEQIQPVPVHGAEGYWVTGGPRLLEGRDADNRPITGVVVVTTVQALIWSEDTLTFRLEGEMEREEAIAIAESLP
jgi:hypothetical protein